MEQNTLFQEKYENFCKAVSREEPSYVPNAMTNNGGGLFWAGKTARDVAGDHEAYAEAISSFLDEVWMDANVLSGLTTSPRRDEVFPTAENRLAKDGTLTHLQTPFMKEDEYDQLAEDPRKFIAQVLLPRKYPYLYESREAAKAILKVYAEEQVDNFVMQMGYTNQYIKDKYGVYSCVNIGCMLNTPLDHIFDYFRGFQGTLTDIRRRPKEVKAALEAIWEYQTAAMVAGPYDPAQGYPFQPCHVAPYLNPKQYAEFYWPYEARLIDWVSSYGSKIYLVMENRFENIWDHFRDVPKDCLILNVDDDDIFKTKSELGDWQILCGGLKLADTRLRSFDDMKDDVKKVIDECAPGGGFIFSPDKGLLTPGDVSRTLFDCYNFAHDYSRK